MKHLFTLIAFVLFSLVAKAQEEFDYGCLIGIDSSHQLPQPEYIGFHCLLNDGEVTIIGILKDGYGVSFPYSHLDIPTVVKKSDVAYPVTKVVFDYAVDNTKYFSVNDFLERYNNQILQLDLPNTLKEFSRKGLSTNIGINHFAFYEDNQYHVDSPIYYSNGSAIFTNTDDGKELVAFPPAKSFEGYAFPKDIVSIGENAFAGCPGQILDLSKATSLYRINAYAFSNCTALENIDIPNTVTYIGAYCFAGCTNLSYFHPLQSALKEIEYSAFEGCTSLHSVTIPRSVKRIGLYAFKGCTYLENVYCYALVPPYLGNNRETTEDIKTGRVFYNSANLIVPIPIVYKNASERWRWNNWLNIDATPSLELIDGEAYPYWSGDPITYTGTYHPQYIRTFSEDNVNNWNAIYVPFAIDVDEERFDIAEIFNLCPIKDTNGDDVIDNNDDKFLVLSIVKDRATVPNKPYLIRPKQAGEMKISIKDATIYPVLEEGKVTCSTTSTEYIVTGTYKGVTINPNDGQYYMSSKGNLSYRTGSSYKVEANRWVMTTSAKGDYSSETSDAKANIGIFVLGEDEGDATAIANILSGKSADLGTYTVDGRKVTDDGNLKAGIYIKNGKKIVIK